MRSVVTYGLLAVNPANEAVAGTIGIGVLIVNGGATVLFGVIGRLLDHRRIWKVPRELRHLLILISLCIKYSRPAAQHQLLIYLPGRSRPRAEIIMISLHNRTAIPVLSGQRESACSDVEKTPHIPRIDRLREKVIPEPKIQGEVARDLPIVLRKSGAAIARWLPQFSIGVPETLVG